METLILITLWLFTGAIGAYAFFAAIKLLKNLAQQDRFFTEVKEPEIKIILSGGIPSDCIVNVSGHTMVYFDNDGKKEDWILVSNEELKEEKDSGWLVGYKTFNHEPLGGYYFFGFLPNVSIAKTKIDAARWNDEPKDIRSSLRHEPISISSLRAKTERRVVFKDVEIGGDSTLKIDIGFTVITTLDKPLVAGFDRQGNFGEMIDEALAEIIAREALKLTDDDLFASKGKSVEIFDPSTILGELTRNGNNIRNSGYKATALIYHGFDFSPDSKPFVESKARVREAEFSRLEQLKQAEADKATLTLRGEGRASAFKNQIQVMTDLVKRVLMRVLCELMHLIALMYLMCRL